jgi:alpha-beta hydrolase superfamily lysophospholipase
MNSVSPNPHAAVTGEVRAGGETYVSDGSGGPSHAVYFESNGHALFGWFQGPPAQAMSDVGMVICKPCGYEAICSHRSLRAFADAARDIGIPTLRIDYRGTGDSEPIDPEADQLHVWTQDIIAAVVELRRRTGVRQVCLLGVRLGALLASLAAAEMATPIPLVLIAPIVSGRRYLRGLRTTRMAGLLGKQSEAENSSSHSAEAGHGSMEVSGFLLSAATLKALASIDLQTRAPPTQADMLLIDGKSMPGAEEWANELSKRGIRVSYSALPGLVEMAMTAPQFAAIPLEMTAVTQAWLRGVTNSAQPRPNGERRYDYSAGARAEELILRSEVTGYPATLTERHLFFGTDDAVFGIVTEPASGEVRRRAVIMFNAGADLHIGVNGMNVTLARQWASNGYVVLRMDLAGLGDSRTRPGEKDNEVFPDTALDDIRAALRLVRDRYNAGDVTLFGLCSGAYHALRAAADGVEVNRLLMVNPQNYFWHKGMTLDDLQLADIVRNSLVYRKQISSRTAWKRLIGGEVDIGRIVKISMSRPLLAVRSTLRDVARRIGLRLRYDLGRELEEIDARGVRIVFVFARAEPGLDLLKIEAGSSLRRLGERCRVRIIDDADHVFSQSGPRATLRNILSEELFSGSTATDSANLTS